MSTVSWIYILACALNGTKKHMVLRFHLNHSICYFDLFPRAYNDVRGRSKLYVCSSGAGLAKDSNAQVKTLFYSSVSKKDQLPTSSSPRAPLLYCNSGCVFPPTPWWFLILLLVWGSSMLDNYPQRVSYFHALLQFELIPRKFPLEESFVSSSASSSKAQ